MDAWRRLYRDERGVVIPFAAVSMVAFFGLGGLVVDLGRLYNTHTELHSYVDAVALAAAAELDGSPGARDRAEQAALNLIADTQTFGTGGADLTIAGFRFFSSIPNDDADPDSIPTRGPIQGGTPATSDVDAVFVEVEVRRETLNLFFMPVLNVFGIGAANQATAQAWATARFEQFVCDITPLMICNPEEPAGNTNPLYPYVPTIGQQIRLKSQGGGSQWAPGDFGLLDASIDPDGECAGGGQEGAATFRCAVAAINGITQCVSRRGVDVRPGQLGTAGTKAFNTRFDMWEGPIGQYRGNANFLPARNVAKGMVPRNASCNQFDPVDPATPAPQRTVGLPRDACFETGTCALGKIGDSSAANPTFDFDLYWNTNHDYDGDGVANVPPPPLDLRSTRYGIYLHEIANGFVPNKSAVGGENGDTNVAPRCTASNVADPNRRTVVAAVVNCGANGVRGNASNVPVVEFVKLFLTEPAGYPDTNDIWVEVVDTLEPGGDDGFLHEFPLLVR